MLRIIITGGPGTGKSSLLAALERKGYRCFPEVSRIIIAEQQAAGGDLFPWGNMAAFAEECFRRMQLQLAELPAGVSFFDRGVPDIAAYMRRYGLDVPSQYLSVAGIYSSSVLICPPWPEIFKNDPQRPETFEETCLLHRHLVETYTSLGFEMVEMPKISIEERALWVAKRFGGML